MVYASGRGNCITLLALPLLNFLVGGMAGKISKLAHGLNPENITRQRKDDDDRTLDLDAKKGEYAK